MRFLLGLLLSLRVAAAADVPVIVELFSSEGCASCPDAESNLRSLEVRQPCPGVHVIGLEEHVDYWNQLGWQDRFSNPIYRLRQNDYAKLFRVEAVYTPQMVVHGMASFVGSDSNSAYNEIVKAGALAHDDVDLRASANARDAGLIDLEVRIRGRGATQNDADVYLSITESGLLTRPARGENRGIQLRHSSVVRSFGVIGKIEPRKASDATFRPVLKVPEDWVRQNLRVVVFVQEQSTRRITAAAESPLR